MPRLLIVDDEVEVAKSLRRLLRRDAHEVQIAGGGPEALSLLEGFAPDLVISDFRMPEMDGAQLLAEVKKRCPLAIRVVLSGYADLKSTVAAVNEGEICRFLSKPWDDEQLLRQLRDLLEQRRAMTEIYQSLDLGASAVEVYQGESAIQLRIGAGADQPFTATRAAELLRICLGALNAERSTLIAGLLARNSGRISLVAEKLGGPERLTLEILPGEACAESTCTPPN